MFGLYMPYHIAYSSFCKLCNSYLLPLPHSPQFAFSLYCLFYRLLGIFFKVLGSLMVLKFVDSGVVSILLQYLFG